MGKRMTAAGLALVGLFVSLYLALYKLGYIGALTCSVGSCETVNTSKWALFMGIPVAIWGLAYYTALLLAAVAGLQERLADSPTPALVLTLLAGWGVLFSGYLTYLELFVIHAICQWCVVSACIVVAIFVVSALDLRETRLHGAELAEAGA
jgi:uncharacterized membrane protein